MDDYSVDDRLLAHLSSPPQQSPAGRLAPKEVIDDMESAPEQYEILTSNFMRDVRKRILALEANQESQAAEINELRATQDHLFGEIGSFDDSVSELRWAQDDQDNKIEDLEIQLIAYGKDLKGVAKLKKAHEEHGAALERLGQQSRSVRGAYVCLMVKWC